MLSFVRADCASRASVRSLCASGGWGSGDGGEGKTGFSHPPPPSEGRGRLFLEMTASGDSGGLLISDSVATCATLHVPPATQHEQSFPGRSPSILSALPRFEAPAHQFPVLPWLLSPLLM